MSKRTERMSRSAAERINRKDTVIRQNNAELEELRSQYENLDICEEDKQVIDDYIACKDARADRMAEKGELYRWKTSLRIFLSWCRSTRRRGMNEAWPTR